MANAKRVVSGVLLVLGVAFVLLGFTTALQPRLPGALASAAAIAALLYAGATWFGASPAPASSAAAPPLIIFDRAGLVVSGPAAGQPLTSMFPSPVREEIARRSSAALAGVAGRFPYMCDGRTFMIDALPVRAADGVIVYGMLLPTAAPPAIVART